MTTHGVPIQHSIIHEEPGAFSGVIDEYARLRGLSKADAEGELMRVGMNTIMANVYGNLKDVYPGGEKMSEDLDLVQAKSLLHILEDLLPYFAHFLREHQEEPAPAVTRQRASVTQDAEGQVMMPKHPDGYHSMMSGVNVTIPKGTTRKD